MNLLSLSDSLLAPASSSDTHSLLRVSRRAMATTFEVVLPSVMDWARTAASGALDLIDALEAQLSVFRQTSEVCRLNRLAAAAAVPVEGRLFDLLTTCARVSCETEGAFDITTGPLIRAWGFYRRQGRVPEHTELAEALACVGMHRVQFEPARRRVRYLSRGVEINLGSIGKGYALDRAAEQLRSHSGVTNVLLHGGGSSVLARGSQPGSDAGWAVGIADPWQPGRRIAQLRLRDRALATSGATYQHFEYNGRRLGHLIDPRSGQPAEGTALATAVAPTAAEADALATAFYVLGAGPTRRYCEQHPEVGAIILPDQPDVEPEFINLRPEVVGRHAETDAAVDLGPLELA